jgi:hydroxymethylpyrimidine kinase/phosphomethylpyrimidine kinase
MRVVLTIAGFDPSGGAGTLADIKTFAALGCFGVAAVTSLTFQNTLGVYGAAHQSASVVRAQIEPLLSDFEISSVKLGMLPTPEAIELVADIIRERRLSNVVLDPVIRSTSGHDLIGDDALALIIRQLLPLATVVTPNMAEAERMTGLSVTTLDEMKSAGERLLEMGARAVLVKGGHLPKEATDILIEPQGTRLYHAARVETTNTHGTGCTLSSAIAALLAREHDLETAIDGAKHYLLEALRHAPPVGHGAGPLNHMVQIKGAE